MSIFTKPEVEQSDVTDSNSLLVTNSDSLNYTSASSCSSSVVDTDLLSGTATSRRFDHDAVPEQTKNEPIHFHKEEPSDQLPHVPPDRPSDLSISPESPPQTSKNTLVMSPQSESSDAFLQQSFKSEREEALLDLFYKEEERRINAEEQLAKERVEKTALANENKQLKKALQVRVILPQLWIQVLQVVNAVFSDAPGVAEPGDEVQSSKNTFLQVMITNIIQAHFGGLQCWGCFKVVDKRVNSHVYPKSALIAASTFAHTAGGVGMKPFWFFNHPVSARHCTFPVQRECLCHLCDNSTSDWEQMLSEQFGNKQIFLKIHGLNEDITMPILLTLLFRGAVLSIDTVHMFECSDCNPYFHKVLMTVCNLAKLHHVICKNFRKGQTKESYGAKLQKVQHECSALEPMFVYTTKHMRDRMHWIEFPLVVVYPDVGPVIFAQIPPYYIAVPTVRENAKLLREKMDSLIMWTNRELQGRYDKFFKDPAAEKWMKDLIDKGCQPMLVFPGSSKCFIDLQKYCG